jgi:hypothetical protein
MKLLELFPAYGRVYFNVDSAISDWEAGLDWQICRGPYCSNRDVDAIKEMGYNSISLIWDIKGYRFAIIKL